MDMSLWTLGVGDGQRRLACCNSWGRKELAMTESLNWIELKHLAILIFPIHEHRISFINGIILRVLTSLFCSRYYNKYLQLFTINMIFSVDLSYMAFIMLMCSHSILILLRVFITNKSWDLWKDFYHPLRLSYSFQFLICLCGASHWFVDIEPSLHSLVRSHFILVCVCVLAKWLQSCLILWDPMNCSPPGSSVHGILQKRMLESVAMAFSRRSSQPRHWTHVSYVSFIDMQVLCL